MKTFHLTIATPDGVKFDGEAEALTVRTTTGDVQILAGHTDYLAALGAGTAKVTAGGETRRAAANGGFLTVKAGVVSLVSTTFEYADEIDLARAKRALERAQDKLREAKDGREIDLAKARIARAMTRINPVEM